MFAELDRSSGFLDGTTGAAMDLVIAYTTLFSPFWIKMFYRLYGDRPEIMGATDAAPAEPAQGRSGGPVR